MLGGEFPFFRNGKPANRRARHVRAELLKAYRGEEYHSVPHDRREYEHQHRGYERKFNRRCPFFIFNEMSHKKSLIK